MSIETDGAKRQDAPNAQKATARIVFQPSGRRGEVAIGKSVLDAARELGAEIETICGQKQTCGKCKVRIEEGYFEKENITSSISHVSPFNVSEERFVTPEERLQGYRLGCMAIIQGDLLVYVPERSRAGRQIVRKEAKEIDIALDPVIKKYKLTLPPPGLDDPLGDFERVQRELRHAHGVQIAAIDPLVLRELPQVIRAGNWQVTVTVWNDKEITRAEPGHVDRCYGLAVDVGTTTVAAYLCDLTSGQVLATESTMNPQVPYGEDVMARITYAMTHDDGLQKMNEAIVQALDDLAESAASAGGIAAKDISEIVLVGNTCMHHLFLNIPPEHLGMSPFPPVIHRSFDIKARDFGLKKVHGATNVHVLPNEAGFVGADNVGVLIAEKPYNQDKMMLVIDIGTNGELLLGNRSKVISSSCATGPAFEGAQIRFGMRAAAGAIEKVKIDPVTYEVEYQVIQRLGKRKDEPPKPGKPIKAKGICGSGIIDAVAELFRTGIIDKRGVFRKDLPTKRLRRSEDGQMEFVLAWADETSIGQDITITQKDVRAVQLAKAAMYAGAKIMMRKLGIEKVDKVVLAGAFGSYIDKEQARIIGMFPDCASENVYAVGNAAGDGARMALLNKAQRQEALDRAKQVEYVELTVYPDFQKEFSEAMYFPHMRDEFPHLKDQLDRIPNLNAARTRITV